MGQCGVLETPCGQGVVKENGDDGEMWILSDGPRVVRAVVVILSLCRVLRLGVVLWSNVLMPWTLMLVI